MKTKNYFFVLMFGLISFAVGVVGVVGLIQGRLYESHLVSFFLVYGFILIPVFFLIRACQKYQRDQEIREQLETQEKEEAYERWSREVCEREHHPRIPTLHDYRPLR